jgi:hypothetical protein
LEVYLADANGYPLRSLPLDNYLGSGRVEKNVWQQAVIPLSDLNATNRVVTGLVVQDMLGAPQPTYYLDDIQLTGSN